MRPVGDEPNDYMQGEADALRDVVSFVSRLRSETLEHWKRTDPEHVVTRTYWRGRHKTCVDILKGLGIDE